MCYVIEKVGTNPSVLIRARHGSLVLLWGSFSKDLKKGDEASTSCEASYFMISRLFQSFLFSEIKTKEGSMTILLKQKDVIKSAI